MSDELAPDGQHGTSDPLGAMIRRRPIFSLMTAGYLLYALGILAASGLMGLLAVAELRQPGGDKSGGGFVCAAVGPVLAAGLAWAARRNAGQHLQVRERGLRWTRFFGGTHECRYSDIQTVGLQNYEEAGFNLGSVAVQLEFHTARRPVSLSVDNPRDVAAEIARRCQQV